MGTKHVACTHQKHRVDVGRRHQLDGLALQRLEQSRLEHFTNVQQPELTVLIVAAGKDLAFCADKQRMIATSGDGYKARLGQEDTVR